MLTAFFTAEPHAATARRTGFVKRAANMTGNIFLAVGTFGVWSDATTTLAQLAAERLQPLALASFLTPVTATCYATPMFLGAKAQVACRLLASRVPDPMVHARRRNANKKAKKKG